MVSHYGFDLHLLNDVEYLFICLLAILYIFFGNMSVQVLCLFTFFHWCCLGVFLCILDIKFLIRYLICEYLLSLHGLPFHSVDNILWCILLLLKLSLSVFSFVACSFGVISKNFFFSLLNQEVIAESSVMKRYPCVFF